MLRVSLNFTNIALIDSKQKAVDMIKKIILCFFVIALLSFFIAKQFFPKKLEEIQKKTLKQKIKINIVSEPCSLDPKKARNLNDLNVIKMFQEGLFRINIEGDIIPALCLTHKLSEDRLTYTIKIREAFWSNGDRITSNDFLSSWRCSLDPQFGSDYAFLLYPIKNASLVKKGVVEISELGVCTPDDTTLVITLEHPTPYFLELLASPIYFPFKDGKESYLFSGPFIIDQWLHSDRITAIKNLNFWDKENVKLDEIELAMVSSETGFSMFLNHELDWEGSPFSLIPLDALDSHQEMIFSEDFLMTAFLRFNINDPVLKLHSSREALHSAINKKEIVDYVLQGKGDVANSLVPPSLRLIKKNLLPSLYATHAITLSPLTLSFLSNEKNYRIAQTIQDQWQKKLNVTLYLEPLEAKVFFSKISEKKYQIALGSWVGDFRDPISFLEIFKNKEIGTNNTGWESKQYENLLTTSLTALEKVRNELLETSEELLINDHPVIPLYHGKMNFVKNPQLKNVALTSTGSIDFRWAHIDQ